MSKPKSTEAIVTLLRTSTCEPAPSRRAAAGVLLDLLRSDNCRHRLRDSVASSRAAADLQVRAEVFDLAEELGLGGPADLLP